MKKLFGILVITLTAFQVYTQTFAPLGAKWVYCYAVNAEGGALGLDSLIVESVEESQFNSLACKTLRITHCASWVPGCGVLEEFSVCQDDQKIFYREGDSLYLLYEFTAAPGDTLHLRYPLVIDEFNLLAVSTGSASHFDVLITDTATLVIGGQQIQSQSYELLENTVPFQSSWYSGQFLEGIGNSSGWLLPRAISFNQETDIPMDLMSYQVVGTAPFIFNSPCVTSITNDPKGVFEFQISPNPASNWLFLQIPGPISQPLIFVITDTYGRELTRSTMVEGDTFFSYSIQHFPVGIYIWSLWNLNGFKMSAGKISLVR